MTKEQCKKALSNLIECKLRMLCVKCKNKNELRCTMDRDSNIISTLIYEHFQLVEEHKKLEKALHIAIKELCITAEHSDACNPFDVLYDGIKERIMEEVEQHE